MRILYVSQYYPPEMGAPAARVSELARHWLQAGHQVTVLTAFPNHPTGVVSPEYRARFRRLVCREKVEGVDVVRTWLVPLPNRRALERIVNYLSFCLSAALTGTFLRRPDVVIATSPQIFAGLAGWWLGLVKRVPFVLEVRDLWPESITASGMGAERSLPIRAIGALARFLYRHARHIVVVTPAFREDLVGKRGVPANKISIVENGVETELFSPDGGALEAKARLGLEGRFVVSYIGTHGLAHGLEAVLEAAARLQEPSSDLLFLFVGEGADKARLRALAQERSLTNVRFLPQQSRAAVPELIRASDVCLVPLRRAEVFTTVIPTKMLEFMACGRPVVLGVDGQARALLAEADGGLFVEPEDPAALVAAIACLHADAALRRRLGENGRRYIVEHLSREHTAQVYVRVLEQVVAARWKRGRRS